MDTFAGKNCVIRCIHDQDRKAWIQMSKRTHTNPLSKREVEEIQTFLPNSSGKSLPPDGNGDEDESCGEERDQPSVPKLRAA